MPSRIAALMLAGTILAGRAEPGTDSGSDTGNADDDLCGNDVVDESEV